MKFNKKVFDLARKLDYMEIESEDRRRRIKKCVNPLTRIIFGYQLKKDINKSYEIIKKEMDELERQRVEYEKNNIEYEKYFNDTNYIRLMN
jgi:hypothetical protein